MLPSDSVTRFRRDQQEQQDVASAHQQRVAEWKLRTITFDDECRRLARFMHSSSLIEDIQGHNLEEYGYEVALFENAGIISQGNTPYCKLMRAKHTNRNGSSRACYCRVISLDNITEQFRYQLLCEGLKIMKYFTKQENQSCVQLYDMLKLEQKVYVFHERFSMHSLHHVIWNNETTFARTKNWITQLIDAAEQLNLCGIAHRFIRAENVLLTNDGRVKLSCFDFAVRYWNGDEKKVILQNKPGLPDDCHKSLWDHLPPECWQENHECGMLDVWSIGVVYCMLLTGSHPFNTAVEPSQMINQWKRSFERLSVPEEIRSLLDDIFKDANSRMILFDFKREPRLRSNMSAISKTRQISYYRVDKGEQPPSANSSVQPLHSVAAMTPSLFSKLSLQIFNTNPVKNTLNEATLRTAGYCIARNKSFDDELFNSAQSHDHYLKATINNDENFLVKIYQLKRMPFRYKNMLLNESTKIMRFFSEHDSIGVHKVVDIFIGTEQSKLYIFYENLFKHKTVFELAKDCPIQRPLIKCWMSHLASTIDFLTYHGISHRYIRPEYIFVHEDANTIKLAHFDMACFVWNPIKEVQVLRHRGLQDEMEYLWDHLPPESFLEKYDSLLVDVWSFGVSLCYCLTGGTHPFSTPHTIEAAGKVWTSFKLIRHHSLQPYVDLLDRIFVAPENRIKSQALANIFKHSNTAGGSGGGGGGGGPSTRTSKIGPTSTLTARPTLSAHCNKSSFGKCDSNVTK